MNSFVRVVCMVAVFGGTLSFSLVFAAFDSLPEIAHRENLEQIQSLKTIFKERQNLINMWKLGLLDAELQNSQGYIIDIIMFIKCINDYVTSSQELDRNIITIKNVNKILDILEDFIDI